MDTPVCLSFEVSDAMTASTSQTLKRTQVLVPGERFHNEGQLLFRKKSILTL
jgi:hypothetical protein